MLMFGTKMKQGDEFLSDTLTDHQKRQRDAQRGENLYLNAQMTEKENYEQLQSSRLSTSLEGKRMIPNPWSL